MSPHDEGARVKERLLARAVRDRWAEYGECRSCGWHAALYEYGSITLDAVNWEKGRVELPCLSGESGHRGVAVHVEDVVAVLARIEALEAERDELGESNEWLRLHYRSAAADSVWFCKEYHKGKRELARLQREREEAVEGWAWHAGGSWRFAQHVATTSGDINERPALLILDPDTGAGEGDADG